MEEEDLAKKRAGRAELVAVILLSVTAILTAWSAFESSKWSGAMSISFSQASTARIEAARFNGDANRKASIQVTLFAQWLQAVTTDDAAAARFFASRFPEPLQTAFREWRRTAPLTNPDAPSSPFEMPQYRIPEQDLARATDAKADAKYAEALDNNQKGDNYTVLAVAFAAVLFFAAMSSRVNALRSKWILLGVGLTLFIATSILLALYPKLV